MQTYYIFFNLGPAAGPVQANTTVLQLLIIEMRAEVLLGLATPKSCFVSMFRLPYLI